MFQILLVEDDPGDVELAKMALAQGAFPCHVTVAVNGKDAMAVLRQQPPRAGCPVPDLVLLDLNMPQMDGREVLREIRGDPALATIPVVVLTTSEAERDVVASYDLGASGFVTKPVDVDELFKLIEAVEQYWFATVRRPHRPLPT